MGMVRLESFGGVISHGASSHATSRCTHWTQTTSSQFQKERRTTSPRPTSTSSFIKLIKSCKTSHQLDLDTQATQTPTSELVVALKALPRAEDPPPPPQTVNELMDCTLKDYEEECVEKGTVPSELTTEVGEWEDQELNRMETHLNDLLYEACPFHPDQFIHCVNPQTEFDQLRHKCP